MPTGHIWYRNRTRPQFVDLPNLGLFSRFEEYLEGGASAASSENTTGSKLVVDLQEVIALEFGALDQSPARFRCDILFRHRPDWGRLFLHDARPLLSGFEAYLGKRKQIAFITEREGEYYLAIDLREVIAVNAECITLGPQNPGQRRPGLTFTAGEE